MPEAVSPMPPWGDDPADTSTVGLLYQQFGTVLIPLEAVRSAYFRNLNAETFKRALRDGRIPLPVTTLDDSAKAMPHVCIYHLAALIEARAVAAAKERHVMITTSDNDRHLRQCLIDAVPTTSRARARQ